MSVHLNMRLIGWITAFSVCAGVARAEPEVATNPDDADDSAVDDEPYIQPAVKRTAIVMHGTTARITVVRTLPVNERGQTNDSVFLPAGMVVTSSAVTDKAGKHRLVLVRAEEADRRFEALQNAAQGRASATMVGLSEGEYGGPLTINVLAPKREVMTLELQLETETCFDKDARYVPLDPEWAAVLTPQLRRRVVDEERAEELSRLCDRPAKEEVAWVGFAWPGLARRASGADRIGIAAGRFVSGGEQAARIELSIAEKMTDIPRDLHTVFVIDTSRSLTADQRETARAVVRSYLAHAPRSSVQVISYARRADAVLDRWSLASASTSLIEQRLAHVRPRNGSEVQAGLREAATWLRKVNGTRRLILISDERVGSRVEKLSTAALSKELPAGTLVHVVGLDGIGDIVERSDGARWAELAVSTGGMGAQADTSDPSALDALMLVRPIHVDNLEVQAEGWETHGEVCSVALAEGRSCEWWGTSGSGGPIVVTGMLWGKPWSRTVALGDRDNLEIARQLRFVLDATSPLASAALDAAAVLSHRWSMIASWGGDGGYRDELGGGGTGWGSICGCDGFGTIGHGSASELEIKFVVTPLRNQLFEAVTRCTKDDLAADLSIEFTRDEVVDVDAKVSGRNGKPAPADAAAIESCIEEGVWDTDVQLAIVRSRQTKHLSY